MTTGNENLNSNLSSSGPAPVHARPRGWKRVASAVPTLLVLAVFAGVAVWGHSTGWRAPKFSELARGNSVAEKEDWCVEHNVPESRCIKCHPELVGANANDWCKEHGVAESKCTICHPEILTTGVAGDWCIEHGVPETGCTLCHPEIAVKGSVPASEIGATVTLALDSTATPVEQRDSGDTGTGRGGEVREAHVAETTPTVPATSPTVASGQPQQGKDPKTCQTHNMRVQFASGDSVKKAGVHLGNVVERSMVATMTANAEVQYNRNRFAQISSPVSGKVWRVEREIGQPVKKGEVIALIDAAEVGRLKADFLKAIAEHNLKSQTLKRMKTSSESGLRTEAELQEADAAVRAASIELFNAQQALINLGLSATVEDMGELPQRRNVQFMGLPKSLAESLDPKSTTANLLPVTAPFDGTVIERGAVAGELVDPSKPIMVVADTTQMWVMADIALADARRIALGQHVSFRPDGATDSPAIGKVTWISTAVDDQTRTVKVRADVENSDGSLLAHTFGKAHITIREAPTAIAVPSEAVQWEGCCHVVFVRLTDDIFQTRKVKLGAKVHGFTEVLVGLVPGEVVVIEGSHVLKSEILKSALGAGCTDD